MSWQPIETASKGSGEDGPQRVDHPDYVQPPRLLLWTEDGLEIGYYDWYYHRGYGNGGDERNSAWCNKNGGEIAMPTHWMPLIEGPGGIAKGKDIKTWECKYCSRTYNDMEKGFGTRCWQGHKLTEIQKANATVERTQKASTEEN